MKWFARVPLAASLAAFLSPTISTASEPPAGGAGSIVFAGATVIDDTLTVGGQPTAEQLQALADAGVVRIVNLRPNAEMSFDEAAAVEALGMAYVHIPVAGAGDVSDANAARLSDALSDGASSVVHCASGNRVGALFALAARADGMSPEEALEVGRQHGLTGLEAHVRQLLGR